MKLFIKRLFWIVLTAYALLIIGVVLSKVVISKYMVQSEMSSFLKQVIERDPNVAAEFHGSDLELETIKRNVIEGGFQLLSFKNVEGEYDVKLRETIIQTSREQKSAVAAPCFNAVPNLL